MTKEEFIGILKERFTNTNIKHVKEDVLPFIENARELDIWSNEYFLQLINMIVFE